MKLSGRSTCRNTVNITQQHTLMQLFQATIHIVGGLYLSHADITNHQFPSEHKYLVLQQHRIQIDYVSLYQCFFLFSGDLEHYLFCFNFYESFDAFISLGIMRYCDTSCITIYPMVLEKTLQEEKCYFTKVSLSAGAAHKWGFPRPWSQGFQAVLVCSLGAAKNNG